MFDWNVHLPCGKTDLDEQLLDEGSMQLPDLIRCFNKHYSSLSKNVSACNFMLFNSKLSLDDVSYFSQHVKTKMPGSLLTILVDFDFEKATSYAENLKSAGVDAIKFHCYFQKISEQLYDKALEMSIEASKLHMPIMIDTSYGSVDMYQYDNLKLASHILRRVKNVPVVLLHSGGVRAMQAMLLAESCSNVFLDTSFSVTYYEGSSIESDLAFAYKRIGLERVLYGSDFPYVSLEDSVASTRNFLIRNEFSKNQISAFFDRSGFLEI